MFVKSFNDKWFYTLGKSNAFTFIQEEPIAITLPHDATIWTKRSPDATSGASNSTYASNQTSIDDHVNSMVPKFIMGIEEISEEAFASFVEQLKGLGVEENIGIQQAAYDRYMSQR